MAATLVGHISRSPLFIFLFFGSKVLTFIMLNAQKTDFFNESFGTSCALIYFNFSQGFLRVFYA